MKWFISLLIMVALMISSWYFLTNDKVKIGVLISTDNALGSEEVLSIKYFAKLNPTIGKYKINYIFKTPSYNKESMQKAYNELVKEGVSVILGPALSGEAQFIMDDINKNNIPVISPTATSHKFQTKKDNFFRVMVTASGQSDALTKYIDGLNISKVSLLLSSSNKSYSDSFAHTFQKKFDKNNLQIIHVTDIENDIKKVLRFQPQGVVFCIQSNELIQLLKPLKANLPNITYLSSTWGYQQLLADFSGSILDNIVIASEFGDMTDIYKKYFNNFAKFHKIKPTFVSGSSYSAAKIALQAIKKVGSNPLDIKEYLSIPREYDYAFGKIKFDEYGDAHVNDFKMISIINGKSEIIKVIKVSSNE